MFGQFQDVYEASQPALSSVGEFVGGFITLAVGLVIIPVYLFFFLLADKNPVSIMDEQLSFIPDNIRKDTAFLAREFARIMEYLEGMPLREYLKKIGQLPVELCVKILLQICQGLSCAHSYSIVHRDIKPENIFLLENNQVKILDFGLACPSGTEDMSIAGTVFYSPPEQIQGSPVDHRSDLYSLGIMVSG